jgi:uridine kinase
VAHRSGAGSLTPRGLLLAFVASTIPEHGVVAVDGRDGAGKTMFADELAAELERRSRPIQRASIDDFLYPPEVRYHRGRWSPEGFWLDSYDYARFQAQVLDPFRRSSQDDVLIVDGRRCHM